MGLKSIDNKKKKHPMWYIVLGVALFVFLIGAVINIAKINIQISEKQAELDAINAQIRIQEIKNSELEHVPNYSLHQWKEASTVHRMRCGEKAQHCKKARF